MPTMNHPYKTEDNSSTWLVIIKIWHMLLLDFIARRADNSSLLKENPIITITAKVDMTPYLDPKLEKISLTVEAKQEKINAI